MRMKGVLLLLTALTITAFFVGYSKYFYSKEHTPESVIEQYFIALDRKDIDRMQALLPYERYNAQSLHHTIQNIEKIKLISVDESKASFTKNDYLTSIKGSISDSAEVKIYWVEYEVKYLDAAKAAQESGKHAWNFVLIKETASSPWLIYDQGY